jgi:hypothetical protein
VLRGHRFVGGRQKFTDGRVRLVVVVVTLVAVGDDVSLRGKFGDLLRFQLGNQARVAKALQNVGELLRVALRGADQIAGVS